MDPPIPPTPAVFCGLGDPFVENCPKTMFGVDLKKLKPRFGGKGGCTGTGTGTGESSDNLDIPHNVDEDGNSNTEMEREKEAATDDAAAATVVSGGGPATMFGMDLKRLKPRFGAKGGGKGTGAGGSSESLDIPDNEEEADGNNNTEMETETATDNASAVAAAAATATSVVVGGDEDQAATTTPERKGLFGLGKRSLKPRFGGKGLGTSAGTGTGGSSGSLDTPNSEEEEEEVNTNAETETGTATDGAAVAAAATATAVVGDEHQVTTPERLRGLFGVGKKSKKNNRSGHPLAKMKEETAVQDSGCEEEEEEEEAEDVNQMLQDMSIPDFSLSLDFDELDAAQDAEASSSHDNYDEAPITVNDDPSRLNREEVYSKKYHPSRAERAELEAMASHLGVVRSSVRNLFSSNADCMNRLLFGDHSIVLRRGPVDVCDNDCELILLTDGFIIAYRNFNVYNPLEARYRSCHLWNHVEFVEAAKAGTLTVQIRSGGETYDIHAVSGGTSIKEWMHDVEHVLVQHAMHDPGGSLSSSSFGWQYRLVRRPGFTTAVTGDFALMGTPGRESLNLGDAYNGSTPLHYAVRQSPCNVQVVEALLRLGSDPNVADDEDRTAMYFAQRDGMSDVVAILKQYGGKPSRLAEMELRGELFGGVEQATKNCQKRRDQEQETKDGKAAAAVAAAAKAQAAQSDMSRAMSALVERGQKIEHMDDKARELNAEAKTFGDLARQLKGEMKNKKWYQL